jgi:predicted dehydrogenase
MYNNLIDITPYMDFTTFDFDSSFQCEIDNFVKLCKEEIENISPVEDGVQIMKILNGIYESATKQEEISLK